MCAHCEKLEKLVPTLEKVVKMLLEEFKEHGLDETAEGCAHAASEVGACIRDSLFINSAAETLMRMVDAVADEAEEELNKIFASANQDLN